MAVRFLSRLREEPALGWGCWLLLWRQRKSRGPPPIHTLTGPHVSAAAGCGHAPSAPVGPSAASLLLPAPEGRGITRRGKVTDRSTWAADLHSPATENDWVLLALVGSLPSVKNQSPAEVCSNPCLCGRRGGVPVVALNLLPPLPSDPDPGWSQGLGRVGGAE